MHLYQFKLIHVNLWQFMLIHANLCQCQLFHEFQSLLSPEKKYLLKSEIITLVKMVPILYQDYY